MTIVPILEFAIDPTPKGRHLTCVDIVYVQRSASFSPISIHRCHNLSSKEGDERKSCAYVRIGLSGSILRDNSITLDLSLLLLLLPCVYKISSTLWRKHGRNVSILPNLTYQNCLVLQTRRWALSL